jgi:hypothetical protein
MAPWEAGYKVAIVPELSLTMLSSPASIFGKLIPGVCVESAFRQLVLCPTDARWAPISHAEFIAMLEREGVLGQPIGHDKQDRFLIGEAFLQLFSFMGCAPSIEFTPKDPHKLDWHEFVFIQLSPVQAQPRWLVDRDNAKPACPHCQRRTREWTQHYLVSDALLQCPHCQHSEPVCQWRWFDAGACARQFVSIVNVYPKESLPTDTLLSQLQQDTGVAWQFFYLHAPLITE